MKNLTHYFTVAKSPSDEPASGSTVDAEENAELKEKTTKEPVVVLERALPKPKKLSLKSKKSQQESKPDAKTSPTVASPDSTSAGEKKRGKRRSARTPENVAKTTPRSKSPQKSFANSMQDILQRVLKKNSLTLEEVCPGSSDTVGKASNIESDSEDIDDDVEITAEISSSITPKPVKKRTRKSKNSPKETDKSSNEGKLSYEELENELMKERLLLAKLKETFLASNPDEESLAKYNSTVSPMRKISLKTQLSDIDENEPLCTPKSGRHKLSNGTGTSKSAGNKPKSPRKSSISTPKSLPPKKNFDFFKKSSPAKKTPENNTQIMKEVLEFLDHSESKNSSPSPKKSSPGSKLSQKEKLTTKSKKHLEFFGTEGKGDAPEKVKKSKKKAGEIGKIEGESKTPGKRGRKKKEISDVEVIEDESGTPDKGRKKTKAEVIPGKTALPKGRKKKIENGEVEESGGKNESPVRGRKKKEICETPATEVEKETPSKGRKKKVSQEPEGIAVETKKKGRNSPKKVISEDKKPVSVKSPPEKKRKRKERTDSIENLEESFAPCLVSPRKKRVKSMPNGKEEVVEKSSPKRKKANGKSDDKDDEPEAKKSVKRKSRTSKVSVSEEPDETAEVKKVTSRRNSGESKKKKSLGEKPEESTKSRTKSEIGQTEEADLNSSTDSVFVDSSQKGKVSDPDLSKSEAEGEKKVSLADSSQETSQKNSLLKYFGKVDKTYLKKEEKSSCLTTKAIVHSPPVSPSKKRKSTGPPFSPRRKKLKSMLADADKIELLSSEIIPNTESNDSVDSSSQEEVSKTTNPLSSKSSPKKWAMRVKLAVQSPSKPSVKEEANESPESSPESKVKRKLFGSQPVKEAGECSSDSLDVQVVEKKAPNPKVNGEDSEKTSQSSTKGDTTKTSSSTTKENETPKPPVKLASIFLKKSTPKPSPTSSTQPNTVIVIDEDSLQAKKEFLSSGVPDIIKQKSEQLKALEKIEEDYFVPFPTISHIGYENSPANTNVLSELEKSIKLRPIVDLMEIVSESLKKSWKNMIEPANSAPVITDSLPWTKCSDVKRQLRYLKKQSSNFPFEIFERKFEKISAAEKSGDTNQDMWTEKYKPQCSKELLGNGACVSELKRWLEEQKASKKKESDDSSDDFISSDDDSSMTKRANNIAIINGPPGCGKTSAVYAVAKDLGCKVLELNASCNRNGKKVLTELLEATQSHQVKQASVLADMFAKGKKRDKKKKKEPKKKSKSEGHEPDPKVMSIILIEDADLIFTEHDDGFIAALSSLSTLSKRPIILVSNSIQCSHLSKFVKQQCLLLEFNKPSFSDIRTLLQMIAVYEMVELPKEIAESIAYETKDLRQALLSLQYHLLSATISRASMNVNWPLDVGKLWWQWPRPFMIPPLTIDTVKKSKPLLLESSEEKTELNEESVSDLPAKPSVPSPEDCLKFHKLASFVDNLALAEVWSSSRYHTAHSEDPCPKSWHVDTADSCLLKERSNLEHVGFSSISDTLSHELISRHTRYLDMNLTKCIQSGLSPDLVRWKKKLKKVEQILLTGLPTSEQTDRGSIFCDYLPMIRSISRSECLRLAGNSKRSNRFFNYLSSLNMHPDESQRTLMCNAFVILNETQAQSS